MAFLSGDYPERKVWFWTHQGGNGDYYLTMKDETDGKAEFPVSVRIVMSGSRVPQEVRHAAVALFRAMEKHGLNKHPMDSEKLL